MTAIHQIPVARFKPDPNQPRKQFGESVILGLGDSMEQSGQKVPCLAYRSGVGEELILIDGECRWRAAKLKNLPFLDTIIFDTRPTAAELAVIRLSIDVHRTNLKPIERARALRD